MIDKCRFFFGILCLTLLFAAPLFGDGASAWKQIGPDGGDVRSLARNPKTPGELYALAGYSRGRVYRSTNGGVSWIQTASLPDAAYDLVTDAVTPGVVYVLCSSGISKSTNRGATFKSFRFPGDGAGYGGELVVHPVKSGIVHAAVPWTDSKSKDYVAVQTSVDGGRTWTLRKLEGPVHWARWAAIAISPKAPDTLYVAAFFGSEGTQKDINRVYKSVDGGATWKKLAFPALGKDALIYDLAADPKSDKRVFVATSEGVFYTTNGGTTWKKPASQTARGVSSIAVDPVRSRVVYAQSDSFIDGAALFRSGDGGATWTSAGSGVYGYGRCFLTGDGRLYLGSCAGIFLSLDGGLSFKPAHKGVKATRISALGLAPLSAGMIYAQASGYAWFATANGGSTWRMGKAFPGSGVIQEIEVSATDVNQAYLLADCPDESGEAFIYKTDDGARSVRSLLRKRVAGIDLAAADPLRFYAAGQIQNDPGSGPRYFGIFRTLDGGTAWSQVKVRGDSDSRATAVGVAPSNPDTIYAGGVSGSIPYEDVMYKSTDGGAGWSRLTGTFDGSPQTIVVDPISPETVYFGTLFSVYRSVDGGGSWTQLKGIRYPYAIPVNRLNPNEVFVGTYFGLFYSRDKGTTWADYTAGLPAAWVARVGIDPVARQVYVGTVGGGVCRRGF